MYVLFHLFVFSVLVLWFWARIAPATEQIFGVVFYDYHKKSYEEGIEAGKKIGHTLTLEEIEQTKLENQIDYRTAARYLKKTCAFCGKSCIHCSKKREEEVL